MTKADLIDLLNEQILALREANAKIAELQTRITELEQETGFTAAEEKAEERVQKAQDEADEARGRTEVAEEELRGVRGHLDALEAACTLAAGSGSERQRVAALFAVRMAYSEADELPPDWLRHP
jgi:predicted  nucleic acid-binding Zn-ribbon protein